MTLLPDLDVAPAPPISRPAALPVRRPKAPAIALIVVGAALVIGPVVGGLFSKAASGQQLLDAFRPHLEADALARYEQDLTTLDKGAKAVDTTYAASHVAPGRFPGIDTWRQQSPAINARASDLLDRIEAAVPDYRKVDDVGGFERVPFLVVVAGLASVYGGCVLLAGSNARARIAAPLVVLASAALVAYPLLSNLPRGGQAGHRLLASLAPVMTPAEVSQLQKDFVVVVTAEGQLDTSFKPVPQQGKDIAAFEQSWPEISSDLATLVGTINDNIPNYRALHDLDQLPGGLGAFPWTLVGVGVVTAGLAVAARPRKENP